MYTRHMTLDAPDLLRQAHSAKQRLRDAERLMEDARQSFNTSIRQLNASGASYREIAAALGISHQHVYQVSHGGNRASLRLALGQDDASNPRCDFCDRIVTEELPVVAGVDAYICTDCAAAAAASLETRQSVSTTLGNTIVPGLRHPNRFTLCNFCRRTRMSELTAVSDRSTEPVICPDCIDRALDALASYRSTDAWESLPDGGAVLR